MEIKIVSKKGQAIAYLEELTEAEMDTMRTYFLSGTCMDALKAVGKTREQMRFKCEKESNRIILIGTVAGVVMTASGIVAAIADKLWEP